MPSKDEKLGGMQAVRTSQAGAHSLPFPPACCIHRLLCLEPLQNRAARELKGYALECPRERPWCTCDVVCHDNTAVEETETPPLFLVYFAYWVVPGGESLALHARISSPHGQEPPQADLHTRAHVTENEHARTSTPAPRLSPAVALDVQALIR